MKKLFILCSMFSFICLPSLAQQFKVGGNMGANFSVGGYKNSDVSCTLNYGMYGSVGFTDNINYFGIGAEIGGFTDHYAADDYYQADNFTGLNVPVYAEYSLSSPYSMYTFDVKMGPSFYRYDGNCQTGFYMDIKPIGFKFDKHNSVSFGYRFIKYDEVKNHSFAVQYKYNF